MLISIQSHGNKGINLYVFIKSFFNSHSMDFRMTFSVFSFKIEGLHYFCSKLNKFEIKSLNTKRISLLLNL